MAISSAMYAAVTGLSALGAGMQTISNNIANVNTVGFKAGRTNYEDLISQNYFSGGRVNQRGCGVKVSSVQSMFTQGSFMSSAQDTDMAIAGEGFFSVRNTVTNEVMYTRAGNFTLTKDGLMEDPSGNILQGWQMSIPKPGQDPVRIGAPTDIKIVVLNAPPVETSQLKIVVNLNAGDSPAYTYDEYELAHQYAHSVAEPLAQSARTAASLGYWDPDVDNPATTTTPIPPGSSASIIFPVSKPDYVSFFVKAYNDRYGVALTDANAPNMRVFNDGTTLDQTDRALGRMTLSEFNSLAIIAEQECLAEAERLGNDAYATLYSSVYNSTKDAITSRLPQWQLEGAGFAGVWNAQENPPIDPENYTYTAPIIIYDSLGAEHQMMIYYQKNPYMENVWDYIITSDPLEDARKDANNNLLLSDTASFSGLIQKGKITFAADNDSARHGGMIKDIEAQNLDLSRTKMATTEDPAYPTSATAVMRNAVVDGYYTGQPSINPATGLYESTSRTYDIRWGAPPDPKDPTGGAGAWSSNVKNDPATS
ncbi:MAG: flagellar hook-basal body complex protein, partial [Candidatus Adiutrix sp.]|nr:flagellar hook-basal body complex protein [Candidatus Adiutrix sp.]